MNEWLKDFTNKKQAKYFIESMFELNPNNRATASELVNHPFFNEVREDYKELLNN
jgi:serine/threonine protein kinase